MMDAIENSAYAVWVRESPSIFAYTTVLSLHAIGLAIIVGINYVVAFRLLGFVPEIKLSALRKLFPWIIPWAILPLGIIQAVLVVLYVVPRTAVLGAILLTGYLGGAVATHVRVANPLFSHVLFPTYVAAFLWGGLILRDARLRALLPIRRAS